MAINKAMQAAIKALSNLDIDVKKTYPARRRLARLKRFYIKPQDADVADVPINCGGIAVPARLYTFPAAAGGTMIFFHGGGWTVEDAETYDKVCFTLMNQTGRSVLSVDYRLAPEHPFPAAVEDCFSAVKMVMCGCLAGVDNSDITVIGDSAGGNLAAAVSLMLRDNNLRLPDRQILIYPSTAGDHTDFEAFPSLKENGTDYLLTTKAVCDYMELYSSSPDDINNPYFAPLAAENLSNQPSTLIITAEFDPLRDEGEAYGRALRDAGNEVYIYRIRDTIHGFFGLPLRYEPVHSAYGLIKSFLGDNGMRNIPPVTGVLKIE